MRNVRSSTFTRVFSRLVGRIRKQLSEYSPLPQWNSQWDVQTKGRWGERAAAQYLWRQAGHRILGRNVRLPGGEIDLISEDQETLVFSEVKTRLEPERNPPDMAVDAEKLARLRRAGNQYLKRLRAPLPPTRIDIIGVVPDIQTGRPQIQRVIGAAWLVENPGTTPSSIPSSLSPDASSTVNR